MFDKSKYPPDWKEISRRIKEREGWKCGQCGVKHGDVITREPGTDRYWIFKGDGINYTPDGQAVHPDYLPEDFWNWKFTHIILTVHHIGAPKDDGTPGDPHDKMDVRECNLISLCQRCHLLADLPEHIKGAKATRLKKKHAAIQTYQKSLWGE